MQKTLPLRSAGAAIAAVLALSSTAGFAQEMTNPVITPVPPTAPVVVMPQASPPVAAPPTIILPSQPITPAAKPEIATATAPATQPRVARTAARPAPIAAAPANAAPANVAAPATAGPAATDGLAAPVSAVPPADVEFAPVQAPLTEPAPVSIATSDNGLSAGELGLIGGALAIGGLAAAAMFAARRRRDPDAAPDDYVAATVAPHQPEPSPVIAMQVAAARVAATMAKPATAAVGTAIVAPIKPIHSAQPTRTSDQTTAGRHVRMAEQGPTADNPFLTRKNRLRRARFLDAQEAEAGKSELSGNWMDDSNPRFRMAAAR